MFQKGLVTTFAILLGLVCLIELTDTAFVVFTENKARRLSDGTKESYQQKLDSLAKDTLSLGIFSYDYYSSQKEQLNLGLDLKGGINVILEISQKDILIDLAANSTSPFFREVLQAADAMQRESDASYVENFFTQYDKIKKEKNLSTSLSSPEFFGNKDLSELIRFNTPDSEVKRIITDKVDASVGTAFEVLRTRIDRLGVTQPNISRIPGTGRILVELPGVTETDRVKKILQTSARLEFWEVFSYEDFADYFSLLDAAPANDSIKDEKTPKLSKFIKGRGTANGLFSASISDTAAINSILKSERAQKFLPPNLKRAKLLWGAKPLENNQEIVLYGIKGTKNGKAPLEGSVADAGVNLDIFGKIQINMRMDADGTVKWRELTKKNIGKPIAVVLDDLVYTAPTVNDEIPNGNSVITGNFSKQEAEDLVDVLKSGKLPAKAKIVQAEVVGPSLGAETIQKGLKSFLFAFVLVLLWMLFYYGRSGLYANIALVLNLFFIIGIMASLSAVLTLPGIAGIVLTMGMAVDANIIIFERIKEELRSGKSLKQSIYEGQKHALSAIIDGNVTTFITALILLFFGTGPIEGFAVTLMIGILCTLFTGILITGVLLQNRVEKGKGVNFWTPITKNWFNNVNFRWMKRKNIAYIFSGLLVIISVISLATQGLNLGIDYTGGRTYIVTFPKPVNSNEIASVLSKEFSEEGKASNVEVKSFGAENQLKITTKYKVDEDDAAVDVEIEQKLYKALKKYLPPNLPFDKFSSDHSEGIGIRSTIKVGPTIADDIMKKGFYAVGFALLGIFLYILFRFRKWQFSLGAVAALFHDSVIVLGVFSLFYAVMPFSLEIDQAFIAAILTVIGYSINDTVIVFDRIRENLVRFKSMSFGELIDKSINQTLGRTFNTSATTLAVVLIILLFGGESIRGFMFALFIGIGFGTYSSVFVASVISYDLQKKSLKTRAP